MNAKTMKRLRDELEERRTDLNKSLEQLRSELRDLSIEQGAEGGSVGNHFADDGSSLGEQERIETAEDNFSDQIVQIDQALERMEEGTYGTCQRCGRPIPVERLEALPFAAYCIECQAYLERQAELFGAADAS